MEKIPPRPTSQTHPNGLGRTGPVRPAPRQILTLIRTPAPATVSHTHRRHSNPVSSSGFRHRRMAQSLRRHLLHRMTTGSHVLQLRWLPPSRDHSRCRGISNYGRDLRALVLRRFCARVKSSGRRCRCGMAQVGAAVPLCCRAVVPQAPLRLDSGKCLPPFPINPLLLWD
jgi:hypothetical protein